MFNSRQRYLALPECSQWKLHWGQNKRVADKAKDLLEAYQLSKKLIGLLKFIITSSGTVLLLKSADLYSDYSPDAHLCWHLREHDICPFLFCYSKTVLILKKEMRQKTRWHQWDILPNSLWMTSPTIKPTAELFNSHYHRSICVMLTWHAVIMIHHLSI